MSTIIMPLPITVTDHLWIPMPDGTRLAARLWLPETAMQQPVPAIFEYIPYRKVDMVRARDERNHPYLAANGFAALRVDMRGSGDSEGHMPDMYDAHELADARHVIDWLAAQPWCNGRVGMFGTSWGGTASLQASIDAPEPLKAIAAVCATHDRYTDDIHHMGGCLLTDSVEWGTTLPTILGAPPSTNIGPDWKSLWQERLDKLAFPLEAWLREEARGAYWRHGSVIHQADRLSVPMLCVGGWADRYSNSVMTLVDRRPDLAWGVVGPWGHHYPDQGHPGPGIGFQDLMLDWWRHWLVDDATQGPDWPKLRVWQREYERPADAIDTRAGQWVQGGHPSDASTPFHLSLSDSGLQEAEATPRPSPVPANLRVGSAGGDTGYFGRFGGLPADQREEDAASLCFDTEALTEAFDLYGAPRLDLTVETDAPTRQLCLRLNDVAPDGTSSRITWAVVNLGLDEALDVPVTPPAPGKRTVQITFPTTAYRIQPGHRLRLSISQSYWPMIWPSPTLGDIRLHSGRLTLLRPQEPLEGLAVPLPPVQDLPADKSYDVTQHAPLGRATADLTQTPLHSGWHQPYTALKYRETDTEFGYETQADYRIDPNDPLSAECTYSHRMTFARPDGTAQVQCLVQLRTDVATYHVSGRFQADWDDECLADKTWTMNIPRRHG